MRTQTDVSRSEGTRGAWRFAEDTGADPDFTEEAVSGFYQRHPGQEAVFL